MQYKDSFLSFLFCIGAILGLVALDWGSILNTPIPVSALASVTPNTDKLFYFTGPTTAAVTSITSVARTLLDDPSYAAIRQTLGIATSDYVQFAGVYIGNAGTGPRVLSDSGTDITLYGNGTTARASRHTLAGITVPSAAALSWSVDTDTRSATDLSLLKNAANTLGLQNGTYAQRFNIGNTYASSSSYEYLSLQAAGTELRIGSAIGSVTGVNRPIKLGHFDSAGSFTSSLTIETGGGVTLAGVGDLTTILPGLAAQGAHADTAYGWGDHAGLYYLLTARAFGGDAEPAYSIAISLGQENTNSGDNGSITVGFQNVIPDTSLRTVAFGRACSAGGENISYAFSAGHNCNAAGNQSTAIGYGVITQVDNSTEIGYWGAARGGAVRLQGTGQAALTLENSASAPTDGGATAGSEADGTLGRGMYAIRRNGTDLFVDLNVAGSITTKQIQPDLSGVYQPLASPLTAIAALAVTDSNIIVGNGTTWVAESGATARTSLGLGTGDSPTFAGQTLTSTQTFTGTYSLSTPQFNLGSNAVFYSVSGNIWIRGGTANYCGIPNNGINGCLGLGSNGDLELLREAADTHAWRRGTNAQTSRIYGSYTSASDYVRGSIAMSTTALTIAAEGAGTTGTTNANQDVVIRARGSGLIKIAPVANNQHVFRILEAGGATALNVELDGSGYPRLYCNQNCYFSGNTNSYIKSNLRVGSYAAVNDGTSYLQADGPITGTQIRAGITGASNYELLTITNNTGSNFTVAASLGGTYAGGNRDIVLTPAGTGTYEQRNSTNAQTSRIYGSYTSASDYVRGSISMSTTALTIAAEGAGTTGTTNANQDIVLTPRGSGKVTAAGATISVVATEQLKVGINNIAYSNYSVAIGASCSAYGYASVALGRGSYCNNGYAVAVGYSCTNGLNSDYSVAVGYDLRTDADNITLVGQRLRGTVAKVCECGYWSSPTARVSAMRLQDGGASFTLKNTATAYTDGGATAGSEADGTLGRGMYAIRRNGDAIYLDVNIAGTVKTLSLGTAS